MAKHKSSQSGKIRKGYTADVPAALLQLKDTYGSYERMAEVLRAHAGFGGINRTTLIRWTKCKQQRTGTVQRATIAVQILAGETERNTRPTIGALDFRGVEDQLVKLYEENAELLTRITLHRKKLRAIMSAVRAVARKR